MLSSIFASDTSLAVKILYLLISVIALLPALTVHEWAHGFAAYKLGDHTAKADGRLSLNPLHHLDPFGSIMLLLVGFGWAKPVPVNTRNFKKPRRDFAIVSAAGPLSNFILAFFSAMFYVLALYVFSRVDVGQATAEAVITVFDYSTVINIGLGLFNLIPIPPLDGSNILMCALPNRAAAKYSRIRYYTRYIMLGLILLNFLPYPFSMVYSYLFMPLTAARTFIYNLFTGLFDVLFGLIF